MARTTSAADRIAMVHQCAVRLSVLGHRALHVHGLKPEQFALVCILVDSKWRGFVDTLMPDADWQKVRNMGMQPIAQGIVMMEMFGYVAELLPNLRETMYEPPLSGMVKVIGLDDGGGIVCNIQPRAATAAN